MGRVDFKPAKRCLRCQLPRRWCVCPAAGEVASAIAVDVLMHRRECFRPSSTGRLIQRVMPASRQHVWHPDLPPNPGEIRRPGRDMWILHPRGEPMPSGAPAEKVQLLLLDGSWSETAVMSQAVSNWGRLVSLPMPGASRYWLRQHVLADRHSTIEALAFALEAFGEPKVAQSLRAQFELHVWASLRARGHKELAREYLATSPARQAFPELLAQLEVRRPLEP